MDTKVNMCGHVAQPLPGDSLVFDEADRGSPGLGYRLGRRGGG